MSSSSVFLTILVTIWGCSEAGLINYANLRYRRMSGGTTGLACDYPGAVALTSSTSVVCMGAQKAGEVIVTSDCAKQLKTINANVALTVRGGDSTGTASIAKGTITVTDNFDGTSTIATLVTALPVGICTSVDYTLYDPATHTVSDVTTCTAVSYGSANMSAAKYDSTLDVAPLVSSSLLSCGSAVVANVVSKTNKLYGVVPTTLYSKVTITATASAAFCRGDLGAPIYCTDSVSGSKVLVGLVASSSCTAGETFLSYDLTGGTLTGFSLAV